MKTIANSISSEFRCFSLGLLNRVRCVRKTMPALALAASTAILLAPNAYAGDQLLPMGGSCTTTFAFTNNAGAVHLDGTCHYLHLGRTTLSAEQLVIPLVGNTVLITNTAVYTAANGDQLHSNFVGTGILTPPTATFTGTETYIGGTGRFSGAAGRVALSGSAVFTSPIAGTGEFTTSGSISY